MNERIKQLAQQAAVAEGWGPEVWQTTFSEKFAELIVRECAELCREKGIFLANDRPNKDFDTIAFDCEAAIKQHFGVEE